MVAGQDAQAAGIDRQHLGDAEFGGEVRHRARRGRPGGAVLASVLAVLARGVLLEPQLGGSVFGQVLTGPVQVADELGVGAQLLQPGRIDLGEQPDRVVSDGVPQLRVDRTEQFAGALVPGPAQIGGEFFQGTQRLGEDRLHDETTNCTHGVNLPAVPILTAFDVAATLVT